MRRSTTRVCLFVPAGAPASSTPALTFADLSRLQIEFRDEDAELKTLGRLREEVRAGAAFVWSLPSLADAITVAFGDHDDDRFSDARGGTLDVVVVEMKPMFVDKRFVEPSPGSVATEVPALLTPLQGQRVAQARCRRYRREQHIVRRPEDTDVIARRSTAELQALLAQRWDQVRFHDRADWLDDVALPDLGAR